MGADIISIIFFIVAIVLAFIRKINIGIVALALAVPCTMLIGLPGKEIIAGVNGNLFITLVGITLLFSIVNDTGALGLLAHKIVAVAGRRLWLIPILLFVAGGIITGAGPGGIPVLAIMIPMGIAVGIPAAGSARLRRKRPLFSVPWKIRESAVPVPCRLLLSM